jgi:uncharacterized metal-binding protein
MAGNEIEVVKEDSTCGCASKGVVIYACSVGSNVGQLANEAAKMLVGWKAGAMSCAVGLGAHASGLVESGKAARVTVALDGCPVQCVRKAMEHVGIKPRIHVVITDLGIKKNYDLEIKQGDVEMVARSVKEAMGQ